ncbi:hypothetical protein CDAR_88481 [Caerostris darwini]|uniref:Uncharacterized protein n=1 Tax=Caerostris darwini TaxID=1538125 RepID=A0AAV4Q3U9_9ARAC|nr:hypothetical protein CDAR_88481 [Caerostris darwini]
MISNDTTGGRLETLKRRLSHKREASPRRTTPSDRKMRSRQEDEKPFRARALGGPSWHASSAAISWQPCPSVPSPSESTIPARRKTIPHSVESQANQSLAICHGS